MPHLRLHRDVPPDEVALGPATYRFPAAMATARRTLVAGVVRMTPTAADLANTDIIARVGPDGAWGGGDATDKLIRTMELTLANMQASLDKLRDDNDEAVDTYRFPEPIDEGPRAA